MIIFRENLYTQWDDTDELKRAKDSDILAEEEKKPSIGAGEVASRAATGAAAGLAIGGTLGLTRGGIKGIKTKTWAPVGKHLKRGLIGGALVGGTILAGKALKKRNEQKEEAEFYNKRLRYAKNQALRREKKDWKANMTMRDGYSY